MKISFDLDDTLIPSQKRDFPTIELNFIQSLVKIEPLREGTKELIRELQDSGHTVGIYTTSYRSISKIRFQLFTYGIKVDFVINQKINRKQLIKNHIISSKYPPAFGIDLHIDDSLGVEIEGEKYNFNTIIIDKKNNIWTSTILENLGSIKL